MDIGSLDWFSILVGAFIGWGLHQLLDIAFWRNRRICTESEVELQNRIKQYEAERQSYETRIGDYENRLSMYEEQQYGEQQAVAADGRTIEYAPAIDRDTTGTADYALNGDDGDVGINLDLDADTDFDLPTVDFTAPNLDIDAPIVDAPDVDLPDMDMPTIEVPDVTVPDLDLPNLSNAGVVTGAGATIAGAAGLSTQIDDIGIDMPSASDTGDLEIDQPELESIGEGHIDDLKVIWGIGPAVEALLNANGITTFARLANTSIGELSGVLNAGGDKFNMIQPYTWPDQARFANDGNWDMLEKLQNELGE